MIVLLILIGWLNYVLRGGGGYTTVVTPVSAVGGTATVQVDVTNKGVSAGTPSCTLTVYATDGSVLGKRPFYPGNIYAGTDNLVTLTLSGFNVPLVGHYSADCQ